MEKGRKANIREKELAIQSAKRNANSRTIRGVRNSKKAAT